jgi:hypothetical protein
LLVMSSGPSSTAINFSTKSESFRSRVAPS